MAVKLLRLRSILSHSTSVGTLSTSRKIKSATFSQYQAKRRSSRRVKKELPEIIKAHLCQSTSFLSQWSNIRYSCQDESRMGLHTVHIKKLTGKGIKPKDTLQWDFLYLWLYGLVEPITGASFFYE